MVINIQPRISLVGWGGLLDRVGGLGLSGGGSSAAAFFAIKIWPFECFSLSLQTENKNTKTPNDYGRRHKREIHQSVHRVDARSSKSVSLVGASQGIAGPCVPKAKGFSAEAISEIAGLTVEEVEELLQ